MKFENLEPGDRGEIRNARGELTKILKLETRGFPLAAMFIPGNIVANAVDLETYRTIHVSPDTNVLRIA